MKNKLRYALSLAGISILAATTFAAPANAVTISPSPEPIQVSAPTTHSVPSLEDVSVNLTAVEQEQVVSGEPMTIVMDATTGMIESIDTTPVIQTFGLIVNGYSCSGAVACYFGGGVPYVDMGFSPLSIVGTGTATGNWAHRTGYGSLTRTVSACSTYTCYAAAGPRQLVTFSGPATGTSYTIH